MISLVLSLYLAVQQPSVSPEEALEQKAIHQTIDDMHAAAARADGGAYFKTFTEDARFIGTDATEHWGLEAFEAYAMPLFNQGRGWTYVASNRVITVADISCRCVAWFDEQLDNASYGRLRGSGVLRLTDEGWKIEQYVLSLAVPNERARAVVDVIKAAD